MQLSPEEQEMKRYLLGMMAQVDQAQLEERLMGDSDFYKELLIAEDELIDCYLANELSEAELQSFENNFLITPARRQKLRFARSLRRYVNKATKEPSEGSESAPVDEVFEAGQKTRSHGWFIPIHNPIVTYSFAAAVLLLVCGISWVAFNNWRTPTTLDQGNILTVFLTPGLTREGGATKSIRIPPGIDTLQLQLALARVEYQSYRAELLTSKRVTVLVKENLKPESTADGKFINLLLPTRVVHRDDYLLTLASQRADGTYEEISGYRFRVLD